MSTTGFEILVNTVTIHIEPSQVGVWRVLRDDETTPLSEHETVNEAELAACALARRLQVGSVVVFARYRRVHEISAGSYQWWMAPRAPPPAAIASPLIATLRGE